MKTLKILAFCLLIGGFGFKSTAQLIVNVRPARPVVVRTVAPSPRHVWVDEDWEWRNGNYVFVGGHWVEPSRPGAVWVGGGWVHHRRGWEWRRGYWR